jgi:hypothetical protein
MPLPSSERDHVSDKRMRELSRLDAPISEAEWPHVATCRECLFRYLQAVKESVAEQHHDRS